MDNIYIINGSHIFIENALILSNKFNIPIQSDFNPKKGDIYIVFGSHEIVLNLLEAQYRYGCSYIIMNSEQIGSNYFHNKYYLRLLKENILFDYNHLTSKYLKDTFDIDCLSYFFFDFMKHETTEVRDIDILFIGTKNDDREKLYNDLVKKYPNKKIEFNFEWKLDTPMKMKEKLSKAKYVLNLPFYTENSLETHRINNALSCGCTVVSLFSKDELANEYYKDYIYFSNDIITYFDNILEPRTPPGVPNLSHGGPCPKKSFEELITDLSKKIYLHNLFIINQLKEKMSLYSNADKKAENL